jgi:hypothetical protein
LAVAKECEHLRAVGVDLDPLDVERAHVKPPFARRNAPLPFDEGEGRV